MKHLITAALALAAVGCAVVLGSGSSRITVERSIEATIEKAPQAGPGPKLPASGAGR